MSFSSFLLKIRKPVILIKGRRVVVPPFFAVKKTASLSADTDVTDNGVSRYFLLKTTFVQKYCSEATFNKFAIQTSQQLPVRSLKGLFAYSSSSLHLTISALYSKEILRKCQEIKSIFPQILYFYFVFCQNHQSFRIISHVAFPKGT